MLYTEWIVIVAVSWICDICESSRMWFIPPHVITQIVNLDVDYFLGRPSHARDLSSHLAKHAAIDWNDFDTVPLTSKFRNNSRSGIVLDFITRPEGINFGMGPLTGSSLTKVWLLSIAPSLRR